MDGALLIHLIWVAETRMIAQGTEGVSRGDFGNGVMMGRSMLEFVPLHERVNRREPTLVEWFVGASEETGRSSSWQNNITRLMSSQVDTYGVALQ